MGLCQMKVCQKGTMPNSSMPKCNMPKDSMPKYREALPGCPWVSGGHYETPEPKLHGLVVDHQGL